MNRIAEVCLLSLLVLLCMTGCDRGNKTGAAEASKPAVTVVESSDGAAAVNEAAPADPFSSADSLMGNDTDVPPSPSLDPDPSQTPDQPLDPIPEEDGDVEIDDGSDQGQEDLPSSYDAGGGGYELPEIEA